MRTRSLRVFAAAEEEANQAFDWYQSELFGLGDQFRSEVKLTLKRIRSDPFEFAIVYGSDIRRARVNRFPFSIIFRTDNESTLILAIFHEKRNPMIWRDRVE